MVPPPSSRAGSSYFMHSHTLVRQARTMPSNSGSDMAVKPPSAVAASVFAALFTTWLSRPNRHSTPETRLATASSSVTSAAKNSTSPRPSSSPTAWWPRATERPHNATDAPAARNARAVASPMPDEPPVTSATFPANSPSVSSDTDRAVAGDGPTEVGQELAVRRFVRRHGHGRAEDARHPVGIYAAHLLHFLQQRCAGLP